MKITINPDSITQEEFDNTLRKIANNAEDILGVPGVYEVVSEFYNNETIKAIQDEKQNTLENLVVLDVDINNISQENHKMIIDATWYEAGGFILVDAEEINYLTETNPEDVGNDEEHEINKIDSVLKRWSYQDGYYHA